jgi:hypothetical protein
MCLPTRRSRTVWSKDGASVRSVHHPVRSAAFGCSALVVVLRTSAVAFRAHPARSLQACPSGVKRRRQSAACAAGAADALHATLVQREFLD